MLGQIPPHHRTMKPKPLYIAFEGLNGCGKSTQIDLLKKYLQQKFGSDRIVCTFEPGGNEISNKIREVFQATKFNDPIDPICETFLVAAARAQSISSTVEPAVKSGKILISDRSFVTSLAFQGGGHEVGIEKVLKINLIVVKKNIPDVVLF